MYAVKWLIFVTVFLSTSAWAQDCSTIFEREQIPSLETLEQCRDFTQRQARRFERPVFRTQLEQDLIERLIYVISQKETCFNARESFFSAYGIRNREDPEADMGEELRHFWKTLKKACPEI